MEEFWRDERYNFLSQLGTVITAHHLNDCVETYLWSSIHGNPKIIPSIRNNVIRPFLATPKIELINWCIRKNINWCEDTSNDDVKYQRNFIRKVVVPQAYKVNPGLDKVVKKMVLDACKP
jgi:tRNA(Ile)-lysidine synthase